MNENAELRVLIPLGHFEFAQRLPVGAVGTIVVLPVDFAQQRGSRPSYFDTDTDTGHS